MKLYGYHSFPFERITHKRKQQAMRLAVSFSLYLGLSLVIVADMLGESNPQGNLFYS